MGFEPTVRSSRTTVFKTGPINRSGTLPRLLRSTGLIDYYDTKNTNVTIPETAEFVSRKDAVKYHIAYNETPIYYDGTFGTLKDLGYITYVLYEVYFDIDTSNPNNSIYWNEVYNQQKEVKNALNEAIVACWRDGYKKASYYKSTSDYLSSYANSLYSYGLTINCSVWDFYTDSENNLWRYESFADWYKEELSFGRDCANWSALIEDWFGTSN